MNYKKEFPIFKNKKLIYFDSAATTQKPNKVIKKIEEVYKNYYSNVHRSMYSIGEKSTNEFEKTREVLANFLNCFSHEIIFTRNCTEAINIVAKIISKKINSEKNEIVITEAEHHSNLIPWLELAKEKNLKIKYLPVKNNLEFDYTNIEKIITQKTVMVAITTKSNVTGIETDFERIIKIANKNKAYTLLDASQSITDTKFNVKRINCDFLTFSSHKCFGPSGVGILYGKKEILQESEPINFGGEMVESISKDKNIWKELPFKFEAGTPNIEGVIGLGEAINFIESIKQEKIKEIKKQLTQYALKKLENIKEVEIYTKNSIGIIPFNIKNIHPHDVSCLLNDHNICIRAGHHCAIPLSKKINEQGTCRISFSIYNEKKEIDKFIEVINKIIKKIK